MCKHTPGPTCAKDLLLLIRSRREDDRLRGIRFLMDMFAQRDDLLAALDITTAMLDTVMAHYGPKMPESDRLQREAQIKANRAAIAKVEVGHDHS